jgi:hypothetical protein
MVPSEPVSPSQNPSDVPTEAESNGPSIRPSSTPTPAMILCFRGSHLNFATHEAAANLLYIYGNVASIHSAEENWLVAYITAAAIPSFIGFVDYGVAWDFV